MGLTRAERETILRWDEEDRVVSLYSASPAVWRKAARLGLKPIRETTLEGEPSGKFYRFPLAELSWRRLGPKTSRTPAQAAADAAAAARLRRRAAAQVDSTVAAPSSTLGDLR